MRSEFQLQMESDLSNFLPLVKGFLFTRFPQISSRDMAFDAWSNGCLKILEQGYTGINADERQRLMIDGAYQAIKDEFMNKSSVRAYQHRDRPTKQMIDFCKMDPRFGEYITPIQHKIWMLRREKRPIKDIAATLNKSNNFICVEMYRMRASYRKWLLRVHLYNKDWASFLPKRKYLHDVMRYKYEYGWSNRKITQELSITGNYVRQLLHIGRHYITLAGVKISP